MLFILVRKFRKSQTGAAFAVLLLMIDNSKPKRHQFVKSSHWWIQGNFIEAISFAANAQSELFVIKKLLIARTFSSIALNDFFDN